MKTPITIKSSEAVLRFGTFLDEALSGRPVIIQRYGTPKAVLVPFDFYERMIARDAQLEAEERRSNED